GVGSIDPPLWPKTSPLPSSFCRMNPSPPKKPAPRRFVNSMLISISPAAQRKASRWHSTALFWRERWMIFPGNGPLNATRADGTFDLKKVRNRLSPAKSFRFRPPSRPPCMRASIAMPSVMNVIAPASARTSSPVPSVIMTACMSSPTISWVIMGGDCTLAPGAQMVRLRLSCVPPALPAYPGLLYYWFTRFVQGVPSEGRHSPEVSRSRGPLRMRRDVEDAIDQERAAPRDLLELPPVLHRPAEADRHRRPRGAVHQEIRRADV